MGALINQCSQTLITMEDIELLLQGCIPNKKLIVETINYTADVHIETILSPNIYQQENCLTQLDLSGEDKRISEVSPEGECDIAGEDKFHNLRRRKVGLNKVQSSSRQVKHSSQCKSAILTAQKSSGQHSHSNSRRKSKLIANSSNQSVQSEGLETEYRNIQGLHLIDVQEYLKSKSALVKAKLDSHNIEDQALAFECLICHKQFSSQKSLRSHAWIHDRGKEFSCETCGKQFLRAQQLHLHARTHTGEKPFSCQCCSKSFTNSSALIRHQVIHNRGKNEDDFSKVHRCTQCGKAFSQKGNLTVHMKIHTGTYDHVCPTCQKSFITSGDLKRHLRVHSKEKPYSCDKCKKRFTTSSSLVCHMRSHSGERPYLCGVCGASFSILSHLKQHNRIHARGDLWPRKKGALAVPKDLPKNTNKENSESFAMDNNVINVEEGDGNIVVNCKTDDRDPFQEQTRQQEASVGSKLKDIVCFYGSQRDVLLPSHSHTQPETSRNGLACQIKTGDSVANNSASDVPLAEKTVGQSIYTVASINHSSVTHLDNLDHHAYVDLNDSQLLSTDMQTGNTINCDIADIHFIITSCAEGVPHSELSIADTFNDSSTESPYSNSQESLQVKSEPSSSCPVSICFINSQSPSLTTNALVQVVAANDPIPTANNDSQPTGDTQFAFPVSLSQASMVKGTNAAQLVIELDDNNSIATTARGSHNARCMSTDTRLTMASVIQSTRSDNATTLTSKLHEPVTHSGLQNQGALSIVNEDVDLYNNFSSTSQSMSTLQSSYSNTDSHDIIHRSPL